MSTRLDNVPAGKQLYIMIALLIIIPFLFYYPSLSYDWLYDLDDDWVVISNNCIKIISLYGPLKGLAYIFFVDANDFHYHPITYLSLSLDYTFFGMNVTVFKVHNLLLHILSGLLLFTFVNLMVKNRRIAFIIAMIFLIHPMNIESVAWASCRRQSLFFSYFLAAAIAYTLFLENQGTKNNHRKYILAFLFWIISMLAKASAMVMPGVFALIYLHQNRDAAKIKTMVKHLLPMLPVCLLFIHLNEIANARNYLVRNFSYSNFDHLIFSGYTYCFYWAKGIFPFPLVYLYPAPSEHLPNPPLQYFIMFTASCVMISLMIYHFYKKQHALFFALGFYTVTILPMLDLIYYPLGDLPMLVSNRYFYHTSTGIFLYIVLVMDQVIRSKSLKTLLAGAYLILLSILFAIHLPVWKNQVAMLENAVKYYPSEVTLYNLALVYEDAGNTQRAIYYLDKGDRLGTDIWINNPWPYYQKRSKLYYKAGKYDQALNDIDRALQNKVFKTPEDDSILNNFKLKVEAAIQNKPSAK